MVSEKKNHFSTKNTCMSIDYLRSCVNNFSVFFKAHRFDNMGTAFNYIKGLLKCNKGEANMERMEEEVDSSEYRAYQQFISNSNWDAEGLREQIAIESSELLHSQSKITGKPTGYIIDESGHLKKGTKSAGVSRQYAGVAGKVDNCQVGVYSSLVNQNNATIINERLFLPKKWIDDIERCNSAGIPEEFISFKTKPELALEMLKQDIERGVRLDWVDGDGLYVHNYEFCKGLDELNQFFVLDVHKDEKVFLEKPILKVPVRTSNKGRKPEKLKANIEAVRLDKLIENINPEQWHLEEIRDTTTGKLLLYIYKIDVWSWNEVEEKARKRTLIITKTTDKTPKIKYSFSNGAINEYTHKEYGYFVAQRYWVERTFDDAKNELGMSDYQVRKWKGWHNHMSLIMLASLFIMKQKIDNVKKTPLLSFRDARILIILQIFGTKEEVEKRMQQMEKRHRKRKYDIELKYRKQAENQINLTS